VVVDSLDVRYGNVAAVARLSFAVERGRIGGLLGPNGCGKTSTLRAVVGLLRPAAGSVLVNGVEQPRGAGAGRLRSGRARRPG
jgi:ABC-type multidrug transport system ATPase subunit